MVLCTYNRADRVEAAVRGVLDQQGCDLELVVVDDGSSDATPEVLAAVDDDRLRVVRRPNGGLGAARNSGLAAARGRWTVFLDDDDHPQPGWLATLTSHADDPGVGVSCCAALHVDPDGNQLFARDIHPLGQPFDDVVGSYAAGTFAARTELIREAGGYLAGLGSSHQFDLFLRLLTVARERGLSLVASPDHLLHLETRGAADRPLRNPRSLYASSTWILARYPQLFAGQHQVVASFEGIAGVAAARQGDWSAARRRLRRAVRAQPRNPRYWGRLALALVPAAGARAWNRHGTWSSHGKARLGVLDQRPQGTGDGGRFELPARELFLPWRYQENRSTGAAAGPGPAGGEDALPPDPVSADDEPARRWVYRMAARLARPHDRATMLDIGCGDGRLLAEHFPDAGTTIGVDRAGRLAGAWERFPDRRWVAGDLADETTWKELDGVASGLTLCVDVLERIDDPVELLQRLADVSAGGPVLVAAVDRAHHDPSRPLGPPRQPDHRREWTADQLELLLISTGWSVVRSWSTGRRPRATGRIAFLVEQGGR